MLSMQRQASSKSWTKVAKGVESSSDSLRWSFPLKTSVSPKMGKGRAPKRRLKSGSPSHPSTSTNSRPIELSDCTTVEYHHAGPGGQSVEEALVSVTKFLDACYLRNEEVRLSFTDMAVVTLKSRTLLSPHIGLCSSQRPGTVTKVVMA